MPYGKSKQSNALPGLSGCFLATYQIQPNYVYSEKHFLYVDSLDKATSLPEPHPPSCPREDIFDPCDYVEVDKRADEAPPTLLKESYPVLLSYLLEGLKVKQDDKNNQRENKEEDMVREALHKVRAIYRWVTGQHVETMTMPKKTPDPSTPMFQLWRIKNRKGNFAQLVSILCRLSNIPCVIIHGKMKGSTYDVGQPIDDKLHYGEWNAVLIGQDWRLLNAYWGACAVGSSGGDEWLDNEGRTDAPNEEIGENGEDKDKEKKGFMFTCDDHYFLPDPRHLIATHLPFVPRWQLRKEPITPERFEEMAFLKDRFFDLGMSVITHKNCVITSDNGEVEILFKIQDDSIYHKYYCLLFRQEGKSVEGFSPKYDRYLFLHRPKYNELSIKIRSPVAGTFRLELVGMDTRIQSPNYDYDWIALYKVKFTKAKERCLPYPDQPALGWGPGLTLKDMGLAPLTHTNGIIQTGATGEAEIEFRIQDMQKIENRTFFGKLSRGGVKEEKLRDRAVYRIVGDKLIFSVRLPRKGEYALKLYVVGAGKANLDKNFCNYMLVSSQKKSKDAYPRGFDKELGPRVENSKLGIEPLSHTGGIIKTEVNEVKLDFRLTKPVEHSCSLMGNELMISDAKRLVSEEVNGEIVTYTVRLPRVGCYGFKLIAKLTDGGVFEKVVDYVIEYTKPDKSIGGRASSTPFLLSNLETPLETPAPEELPEDVVKKRLDAAILTEDVEELGKAIEDMKNIAEVIETPRREEKKAKHKSPNDGEKTEETSREGEKTSLPNGITPREERDTPRENGKIPRAEDETDHVQNKPEGKGEKTPREKEKTPRKKKTPREKTKTTREGGKTPRDQEVTEEDEQRTPRVDEKTPRDQDEQEETQRDDNDMTQNSTTDTVNILVVKTPRDNNDSLNVSPRQDGASTNRDLKKPLSDIDENEDSYAAENNNVTKETPRNISPEKTTLDDVDRGSKPIANGNALPPIVIAPPPEEEPEVIESMMAEVNAAEERERAEKAKEELARAERELQIMKVRKELIDATAARELKRLLAITKLIREKGYQSSMTDELKKGKSMIERLQHIQRLLHDVLELDQSTIAEIKGYSSPPPAVSKVLSATLLILGHFVEETKDWIKVQNILGRTGKEALKRRLEEFDINQLQPDIALGAKEILKGLSLDQIRIVSAGAATFYVWSKGLINEVETRIGEDINSMRPRTSKSRRARRAAKQSKQNKLSPLTRVDL